MIGRIVVVAALLGAIAAPVAGADPVRHTQATVRTIVGAAAVGTASLTSNDAGAAFTIRTGSLPAGSVVTVWAMVFNHPQFCVGGCGADDLARPAVGASSLWAAGHVIGETGTAGFAGRLEPGDGSTGVVMPGWLDPPPGLTETRSAEIHLVLRTHGPKIAEMASEQLSTFGGGCSNTPAAMTGNTGAPGPNACTNIQAAVLVQS